MNDYVLSAGGLVERPMPDGVRVAVVHRNRYVDHEGGTGDWVLPKGKLEPGETLENAALREVEEETGCQARIAGPGIRIEYLADGAPKVATFFRMEYVRDVGRPDTSEVAEVVWLAPAAAVRRLTYESERQVVRDAYPGVAGSKET